MATVSGLADNTAVIKLSKNIASSARYVKIVVTQWSGNATTYGISPYELAVFESGEEPSTEVPTTTQAPTTTAEPTTQAPHIEFTDAYRQEVKSNATGVTHYAIWAYWNAVPGAAGYK